MKRLLLLATLLPMLFVACNNEENHPSQPEIVGLWELSKAYIAEDDRWWYAEDDISELYQLQINNDSSGKFTHYLSSVILEDTFTWQVVDNQFRLVLPDKKYRAYKIKHLGDGELVLIKDLVTYYYKRRK